MTNLDNKLKEWLDLANVVETIKLSRGDTQLKALDLYQTKAQLYLEAYGERFNILKRPK